MDFDKIQIEPPSNSLDSSSNTETTNLSEETPINLYEKYKNKLVLDLEKDIILPKPNVSFDDIVGHESAKNSFMECVILPLLYPQLFVGIRRPINRIWLYGESGTGKHLLLQACMNKIEAPLFVVEMKELLKIPFEKARIKLRQIFEAAKAAAPAVLYIHDIGALFDRGQNPGLYYSQWRRTFGTEFLVQLHSITEPTVYIVIITQKPWNFDAYIRRKFEKRIHIRLPNESNRKELIQKQLNLCGIPHSLTIEDQEYIVKQTERFSGALIKELVRKASYEPRKEAQKSKIFKICGTLPDGAPIYQACSETDPQAQEMSLLDIPESQLKLRGLTRRDFEKAFCCIQTSVDECDLFRAEEFTKDFGME